MHFGKILSEIFGDASTRGEDEGAADDEDCHDHRPVLRYKALKKLIKAHAKHHDSSRGARDGGGTCSCAQANAGGGGAGDQAQQQQQQQQQTPPGQQQGDAGAAAASCAVCGGVPPISPDQLSADEALFVRTLNEDLSRLNDFFVEKEEESVIKLQALSDRIKRLQAQAAKAKQHEQQQQQQQQQQQREEPAAAAKAAASFAGPSHASIAHEAQGLRAELVDLHGEMVLLQHWSMLNYSGVVKIIKKHDKHSDILMRAPYLESVLQQPFYSHGVMCRLVRTAEQHIDALASSGLLPSSSAPSSGTERGRARAEVFKQTQQALETWRSMREGAKTPSTVLPAEDSELLRQLHVRERWAQLTARAPGAAAAAAAAAAEAAGVEEQQQQQQAPGEAASGKRGAAAAGATDAQGGGPQEPGAKRAHAS